MPEFLSFESERCGFPSPAVPVLPGFQFTALLRVPGANPAARALTFARGRYALHGAGMLAGLGPGTLMLAPSYHCRTMLDPALALGAEVAFYGLDDDLTIRLENVEELLNRHSKQVKAVLAPHYFGRPQPHMAELAGMCVSHGVTLLEDCSHAWYVAIERLPMLGREHHFITASPYKFFGCAEGGVLWGPPQQLGALERRDRPFRDQVTALLHAVQRASGQRRTPRPPAALPDSPCGSDRRIASAHPSVFFNPDLTLRPAVALVDAVLRRAPADPAAVQRRLRYAQWRAALADVAAAEPLLPDLGGATAPYMFPLVVADDARLFTNLKAAGLPMYRWDDLAVSDCPVAARYRLRLLHLPCHQDLTDGQMDWMTGLARRVLQ